MFSCSMFLLLANSSVFQTNCKCNDISMKFFFLIFRSLFHDMNLVVFHSCFLQFSSHSLLSSMHNVQHWPFLFHYFLGVCGAYQHPLEGGVLCAFSSFFLSFYCSWFDLCSFNESFTIPYHCYFPRSNSFHNIIRV